MLRSLCVGNRTAVDRKLVCLSQQVPGRSMSVLPVIRLLLPREPGSAVVHLGKEGREEPAAEGVPAHFFNVENGLPCSA